MKLLLLPDTQLASSVSAFSAILDYIITIYEKQAPPQDFAAALPAALSQRTEWNVAQQGLKRLLGYIQIAAFHMVIYNPDCLHICIYNRTAYKLKAALF